VISSKTNKKFSKAADDGRCPKCGGLSFKAKRSGLGKLGFGVLARKTRTKCQSCGYQMRRG
jgi:hypothetical protein